MAAWNSSTELPASVLAAVITSVTIQSHVLRSEPGIGKKSKYTAFVITVRTQGGQEWSVERRYSEFSALNKVRVLWLCVVPCSTERLGLFG